MLSETLNGATAKTKSVLKNKKLQIVLLVVVFLLVLVGFLGYGWKSEQKDVSTKCIVETYAPDATFPDVAGYEPKKVCVEFEWARTTDEQKIGLSKYDSYSDAKGMLFEYKIPVEACIWMKDMKFPIDIVWVNSDNKIVKIEVNVSPKTYPKPFCSEEKVKYVIELNQYVSEYAGLKVGQLLSL